MNRILFATDLHFMECKVTGKLRADQQEFLDNLNNYLGSVGELDVILLGGDNSGHQVPHLASPIERNAHTQFRQRLAEYAPVVEVFGNHDSLHDYDYLNKVSYVEGYVGCYRPRVVEVSDRIVIACLPWPRPDIGQTVQEALESDLVDLYEDVAQQCRRGQKVYLLAHVAVREGSIREGQPVVPTSDPLFDVEWAMNPDGGVAPEAAFFGHYHLPQSVYDDGKRQARYGGSLFVNEYDEPWVKGFTLYEELDGEQCWSIVPVRQHRRINLEYDLASEELEAVVTEFEDTDHLRLRIQKPPGGLTKAMSAKVSEVRKELADASGTVNPVRVVYVQPPGRTRAKREGAAEVAKADTIEAKLEACMQAQGSSRETVERAMEVYREL